MQRPSRVTHTAHRSRRHEHGAELLADSIAFLPMAAGAANDVELAHDGKATAARPAAGLH